MPNHPLFCPVDDPMQVAFLQDHLQLALAIADESILKTLVVNCIPRLIEPNLISHISAIVGVPTPQSQSADGILQVEVQHCVLVQPQPSTRQQSLNYPSGQGYRGQPRCESSTQTLGPGLSLPQAQELLTLAGFETAQVEEILHLPKEAWHKSWWYSLDGEGEFTLPFLRLMRMVRYPDGTLTLQYKDYFDYVKTHCFQTQPLKILVAIKPEIRSFGETLRQINHHRHSLGIEQAILICNTISEMEAEGFIRQGISIYPAVDLSLPLHANCDRCAVQECPMNGTPDSPVALCRRYRPLTHYI